MRPALLTCAALLAAAAFAQTPPQKFKPFPIDMKCVCLKPLDRVPGLRWSERGEGQVLYQIYADAATGRELFRFGVGDRYGSRWVKFWLYGIVHRADYNGDGRIDYAWSGGDDTSHDEYLLLSESEGYRKLDVVDSLVNEWARRYPRNRQDFHRVSLDYNVKETVLENDNGELALAFRVETLKYPRPPDRVVRVAAKDFVFSAK